MSKAEKYYNEGKSHHDNGNIDEAIKLYEKALKEDEFHKYALNDLGVVLEQKNRIEEAKKNYEKAISSSPDYHLPYYNLARIYQNENQNKAIDYCKKAIEIDENYKDAYNLWGNILLAQNKTDEAREKYQQCIKIDKYYESAYYNIAFSYLYEDPSKAIDACKTGINKFPNYTDFYWVWTSAIALLKENSNLVDELVDHVENANSSMAYWRLANFFNYNLRDFEKALTYYNKSAALSDHAVNLALDYSNVYDAMGNLEKAFSILYDAVDQEKQTPDIHVKHNIAHLLFKSGQYEKSRDLWKEILIAYEKELNENISFTNKAYNYLYFGNVHLEIFGNLDEAEEVFKEGLERENKNLELLVALNRIYAEKDKRAIDTKTSLFWQRNSLVKNAEEIFNSSKYKHEEYYFQMAELYYLEENHDKAKSVIDDYFKLEFPHSSRWHNLKGQVFTAKGERSKAIDSFKQAIKLEGHNLSYRTNLANAYLKSDDFKEAEIEFRNVLKRDPNNVDALIGLGEINLNLYRDDSWGDIHFDAAENYLLQALRVGTSIEGSRRLDLFEPKGYKERVYKDLKLSDLYYSIGYLKYEKYKKSKISNRNQYLNESLNYMVKARKCNPDNLKAKNAENKIFVTNQSQNYSKTVDLNNFCW